MDALLSVLFYRILTFVPSGLTPHINLDIFVKVLMAL